MRATWSREGPARFRHGHSSPPGTALRRDRPRFTALLGKGLMEGKAGGVTTAAGDLGGAGGASRTAWSGWQSPAGPSRARAPIGDPRSFRRSQRPAWDRGSPTCSMGFQGSAAGTGRRGVGTTAGPRACPGDEARCPPTPSRCAGVSCVLVGRATSRGGARGGVRRRCGPSVTGGRLPG